MEKKMTAYAMVQGANNRQYKILKMTIEEDVVLETEQVGSADLKPVVLGRFLKMLVRL